MDQQEELTKCKNDFIYFYNNYVRKENEPLMDDIKYDSIVYQQPIRLRKIYDKYYNFGFLNDMYKYLPGFLIVK
jgi:hypothetical protein